MLSARGAFEAELARPERSGFAIAAILASFTYPDKGTSRALRAALASPARAGASAAEAAWALVRFGLLSPRSRALPPIVLAAPPRARAAVLDYMLLHGAPISDALWAAIEELLTSTDATVLEEVRGFASELPWKRRRKELSALLPRIVDPEIVETLRDELDVPKPSFWRTITDGIEG